jgi:hypothetical protein
MVSSKKVSEVKMHPLHDYVAKQRKVVVLCNREGVKESLQRVLIDPQKPFCIYPEGLSKIGTQAVMLFRPR